MRVREEACKAVRDSVRFFCESAEFSHVILLGVASPSLLPTFSYLLFSQTFLQVYTSSSLTHV